MNRFIEIGCLEFHPNSFAKRSYSSLILRRASVAFVESFRHVVNSYQVRRLGKTSMNSSIIVGGCLCGSIRYEATGEAYNITHCHCLDCRRSSGAAFVTWASFGRSAFRFTTGQPRELPWAGRLRSFCPDCGTPLTLLAGPDADEVDVTVCSFDQSTAVTPADHTWVEDRLPWIRLADNLPTYRQKRQTHAA